MNRRCLLGSSLTVACCLAMATSAFSETKTVTVKVSVDSQAPGYEGFRAIDGDPNTMWHTEFGFLEPTHPHEIVLDLGASYEISGFGYLPRPGAENGTIKDFECYVSENDKQFGEPVLKGTIEKRDGETVIEFPMKAKGRYVRLRGLSEVAGQPWTSIAELRLLSEGVFAKTFRANSSSSFGLLRADGEPMDELDIQFVALKYDLRNTAHFAKVAPQVFRPEAVIHESDRDPADVVLRRTAALLADLKEMPGAPDLGPLETELQALEKASAGIEVANAEARSELFREVCQVRRKIAFSNPLLDFDKILFITRHRPGFNHMCDQYYGINAKPGGGLYVLSDPFGPEPQVRNVLADSVVERGRLTGGKLEGGSFVAPDLSYDARRVAFAYVQCQGDTDHRFHTDPSRGHWHEGRSYHVFKVNLDGSGLEQLTDGTWNDFDPCWLPNGRIAFITERRGGYLRCGRVCPTYTLFDMVDDGTDIRCLSYHETNEWHPSVTRDGRIVYTRWDYVDRFGCTAHLPWITTLDGRDSRAVHGNFAPRALRPDMELDVRAIPGSARFVATAAPHHGQAFGSLVLVDPHVVDDDAMAPVKRITPEIGFPESQGGAQVYGTAWPLSENYYLSVYDVTMQAGVGFQGGADLRGDYGIYLVDTFGNKELVYR
ncbi:MAG: discoidin domain-containing protein, partial [Planctomycetota bacterium]